MWSVTERQPLHCGRTYLSTTRQCSKAQDVKLKSATKFQLGIYNRESGHLPSPTRRYTAQNQRSSFSSKQLANVIGTGWKKGLQSHPTLLLQKRVQETSPAQGLNQHMGETAQTGTQTALLKLRTEGFFLLCPSTGYRNSHWRSKLSYFHTC